MARCPPGVICIENITIAIVLIVVAVIGLFFHIQQRNTSSSTEQIIIQNEAPRNEDYFPNLLIVFSDIQEDILLNPYSAPLRNDNLINTTGDPRGIPINVRTQGVDSSYRQIGILTRINGPETILPLMGRPLLVNRDKWQFYTISDKHSAVKLPITNKGRSCTNEYGCDNLYNGDSVYVEGYNDAFKVTVYDNAVMQYIPYL